MAATVAPSRTPTAGSRRPATGPIGPIRPADPAVPLTLLVGPPGVGRTRALRCLREAAEAAGEPVQELRLAAEDRDEPWYLAGAVLAGLAPVPTRLAAGRGTAVEPPAATLTRAIRGHRGMTVFIDDAQWADPYSAAALLAALHGLGGGRVRWVATVRSGSGFGTVGASASASAEAGSGVAAAFRRLRAAGLVRIIPVRPLGPAESDLLAAQILKATPQGVLRDELRRLSLGRPAAVIAAAEGYRASSALRVSDRRAFLTDPTARPAIPADHQLLAPVRGLAADTFAVARALAVLQPVGPAGPALIARATALTPDQIDAHLATLRAVGIAGRHGGGWRITVPAMAMALTASLGPYERRRIAQLSVEAILSGEASCPDPDFLPDQAAIAGRLVDPRRSAELLREHARRVEATRPTVAARWLTAAAELSASPHDRAEALLATASAAVHTGQYAAAQPPLRQLLGYGGGEPGAAAERPSAERTGAELIGRYAADGADGLSAAAQQEAELLALITAAGTGDSTAVRAAAAGEPWPAGSRQPGRFTQAAALSLLDRWSDAADLLREAGTAELRTEPTEQLDPLSALVIEQVAMVTGSGGGPPWPGRSPASRGPTAPDRPPAAAGADRRRVAAALGRYCLLVTMGDAAAARRALTTAGLASTDLPAPERCLSAWQAGRWPEALAAAQASIAAELLTTRPSAAATVCRAGAEVLIGQGWPTRARAMLEAARTRGVPLGHLAAPAAVDLERALGDIEAAARIAEQSLSAASRAGVVLGTDELWLLVAELAVQRGDRSTAVAAADSATAVAAIMGDAASALRATSARLVADPSCGRTEEVLRLARSLSRPDELARAVERVVRYTGEHAKLLTEAYQLYGDLGAILHRSRVRQAMREHGVPVPGRADTLAEGEKLLAVLVAEGLSNRELAAITGSSEKGVEGRLSRLFTRTGYRSRVELAAAVLVGDYQVG